jgi:molybdopterin-biosynthesis enzyme MoeA-like protein
MSRIGAVIVGDEILSGRRADKHLHWLAQTLSARGLSLAWARFVADVRVEQVELYRETLQSGDTVFSFGGIGATPDDHTRAAAAEAAGRALVRHPDAVALIEGRFGDAAHPHRIRMAELPEGCTLIPNPVNQIPGFSLGRHHFLPGFPEMAWPMVGTILDRDFASHTQTRAREGLIVPEGKEGDLIDLMEALVARWPALNFSCLPSYGNDRYAGPHLEFTLTGEAAEAAAARAWLADTLTARGYRWQPPPA